MNSLKITSLAFSLIILFTSCENETNTDTQAIDEIIPAAPVEETNILPLEESTKLLNSIPASNEITATIKASGAPFSTLVLNNPKFVDNYSTNFRKAINLGIYGTDIGYIGVYDREDLLADHIKVIHQLADDLGVAHMVQRERIENVLNTGNISDSIFKITGEIFTKVNNELKENDRHTTSLLILTGSWLEAVHIATTVTYNSQIENSTLKEKIGEQKFILEKFILLLNNYKSQPFFNQLVDDLLELKLIYDKVEITEDELINEKQRLLTSTSVTPPTSPIEITNTQLAKITIRLEEIRKNIIQPV